jgi:hypothetical protein
MRPLLLLLCSQVLQLQVLSHICTCSHTLTLYVAHREKKEQAVKQAGLQRRRAQLEKQLIEEKQEVAKDPKMESWLGLIKRNSTPTTARIHTNSITARALAKAMWTNTSLTSLDLTRCGLDDFAGAYIAKLLKRNKALIKLELDANELGPQASLAFAEALTVNSTLQHLSLEVCYTNNFCTCTASACLCASC